MEKILCPIEQYKDQEIPLYKVFDTLAINRKDAVIVGKITQWLALNKNSKAALIIHRILKANLGENYELYKEMYLGTFDEKTLKMARWHCVESEKVNDIFDIFAMISSISNTLSQIVTYYNRKGK